MEIKKTLSDKYVLLIVDDNSGYREALSTLIYDHYRNIKIIEGSKCAEVHQLIRQSAPDAVILDLNLPDGNGLSVIKEIKACNQDARIIILSCSDYQEYRDAARELGADIFLSKNSNTLNQCVDKMAGIIQPSPG